MDALRASILHLIDAEIKQKESLFKNSLGAIDSLQVPKPDEAKTYHQKNFYVNLKEEYSRKLQSGNQKL